MQLYVGVTDYDWYRYLAGLQPDEINFWQPGGTQSFKALHPGEPFLFKLKAPHNAIAGGGFFVNHTFLPLSVAWETFGKKNGLPDYWSFADKIKGYRRDQTPNPTIGCIVLTSPFFFEESDWIPLPADWAPQIVQGKTYDMNQGHMTLTKDHHIEVSRRIREEFENGRDYYALHGKTLRASPATEADRPSEQFIAFHNEHVFAP